MQHILPASHYPELNESINLLIRRTSKLTRAENRLKKILILLGAFYLLLSSQFSSAQESLAGLTSNGGPDGKGTAFTIKTNGTGFAIAKSFADWGKNPTGGLIQGADGSYYGMTNGGGTFNNYGTIFKITSTGVVTVLRQLNFTTDGAYPYGDLTLGADGNFYGLTSAGGTTNYGTIFKITPAGIFTVLRAFSYTADGANPQGTLVLAADGNFYGITRRGGSTGWGTIFKVTPAGVYSVIKTLNGTTDGGYCYGSIAKASDGNFYGITYQGGTSTYGTIFKVTPAGVYTVLKNLGVADGRPLSNGLVQHTDGFLYGMIHGGGINGNGSIFKISTSGVFTLLKSLAAHPDGSYPVGALIVGTDGNLYGTNSGGGLYNAGTIFKISTTGVYTRLKDLTLATDGGNPKGNLFKGTDGFYYGMTSGGGSNLYGTAFKISAAGIYTVLTRFNGSIGGSAPFESLVQGKDYLLYGTTFTGGAYDFGTVFKLCGGTVTVLRSFDRNPESNRPKGSLIEATDGFFYGMAPQGGNNGAGTIFKISSTGAYTILHHFALPTEGGNPQGSLIQGADGYLYGMAKEGGKNNVGTIFKISTTGVFKVIRHLLGTTDGGNPEGGLIKGLDSNFYGMTYSNARIFKISPNGVVFTVLKTLSAPVTQGSSPSGSLVLGVDGNFYGTCYGGGTFNRGIIFKITPAGIYTVLKHLNPVPDGGYPGGSLVQAADGNFYGMNSTGGTYNAGTIFRISSTGVYAVIRHLDLLKDGGAPFGNLIIQKILVLIANPQAITVTEDVAKAIILTGSGATPLTYTIVTPPKNGTVTAGTAANRTYLPKANYAGKDSFYFTSNFNCFSSPPAKVLITVTPVNNDAPVLDSIRSKFGRTGTLLTFTAKATEYDAGQTKTFSLIGAPAGATIDAVTGVFKWTPAAIGVFTVKVRVNDNGSPVLYDEETVKITTAANFAPVLDSIRSKSIKTGTLLTFTAKATDIDAGQTKTFSLIVPPAGATIDAITGVFKWTPAASGVFTVKVRVTDNGTPVLYDEEAVKVTAATNFAPVLDSIRSKKIKVGTLLTFTAKATDIDAGQTKTFSLIAPPAGATIDAITGIFKWTPAASGVFTVKVRVTDNGVPVLFDEEAVTITAATNFAPVLDSIRNKTVKTGVLLTFTAKATDIDAGQTKTFSLIGAPAGATIVATTGVFKWTPSSAGVFKFKVRVTDNGSPVLFDEEEITVTVTTLRPASDFQSGKSSEENLISTLVVYPNPVINKCIVELNGSFSTISTKMYDVKGALVRNWSARIIGKGKLELDMTGIPQGQYIVQFIDGNKRWVVKLIKL